MSVIDGAHFSGYAPNAARNEARGERESWLRALEQAGLKDALDKVERFVEARGQRGADTSAQQQEVGVHGLAATGAAVTSLNGPGAMVRESPPQGGEGVSANAPFQFPVSAPETGEPPLLGVTEMIWRPERGGDPIPMPALTTQVELMLRRKWEPRRVTVLPYEHGVEVWVRDARLSDDDQAALVDLLRDGSMGAASAVKRVFVNGREVGSKIPVISGQLQISEV